MAEEADQAIEMASKIAPGSAQLYQEMSRLVCRASLAGALAEELNVSGAATAVAVDELDPAEVLASELREHGRVVQAHPDFPDCRYKYGLLLKSAGRAEEAMEQFRAAVAINPTYVKALVKLGLTAWETGRLEEARKVLEKAVNLQPEYVDLHYRLGLVYADQGLWPLAVEEYRRALSRSRQPNAEGVEASLALALENMGLTGGEGSPFVPAAASAVAEEPEQETPDVPPGTDDA
jgi:tetratricopeptide (TPR) repeat protein